MFSFSELFGRRAKQNEGGELSPESEQEIGGEMPSGFARVIDEVLNTLAAGNPAGEGEAPNPLDFSAEMNREVGAALLGKLTAETALRVERSRAAAKFAALEKAALNDCAVHKQTEAGLHEEIGRLERELDTVSSRRSEADRTVGRLRSVVFQYDALTAEISAAVAVGAPLTAAIIQEGIRRACQPYYGARTYLLFPPPPAPPAEPEAAQQPAQAPASEAQPVATAS